MSEVEHPFGTSSEFQVVYDLADPRAYFQALAPLDYRMPQVTCGALGHLAPALKSAFGTDRLRALDFGCGFGVNGALLTHDVGLAEIYAHFDHDEPSLARDLAFFRSRRFADPDFLVGGIDIAEQALAYGLEVGLLEAAFAVDLTSGRVEPPLADFLAASDLLIETGAVFDVLVPAFDRLLAAARPGHRPWVVTSPRPDMDIGELHRVFDRHGYHWQVCNRRPIRYRKLLGRQERDEATRLVRARGEDPAEAFGDGYYLVNLLLARPEEQAAPVDDLLDKLNEGLLP